MKRLMLGLSAALSLSACAGGYYGPGPGGGAIAYDAYYDGAYGPFYDGYWGPDNTFYYARGPHHRYVADRSGHFVREKPAGGPGTFQAVHGPGNFRGGPGAAGRAGRSR